MARSATINDERIKAAQEIVKSAKTAKQLRKGLSIILPSAFGVSNATIAQIIGAGPATVVRMQKEIRDQAAGKPSQKGNWGGRRRQLLSIEEEKQFLEPWAKEAQASGVLVVQLIHKALEKRLEYIIPASTIYRMLARHGWRKLAPDTSHPHRDEQVNENFNKNSQRYWVKLPR